MATLQLWQQASNYMGDDFSGYYIVATRSRDSDILAQSNFETALELLGGEKEDTIIIAHSSHWLCGWVDMLLVHKDDVEHTIIAQKILEDIENYPILDEQDYCDREYEAILSNITDSLHQIPDIDDIPNAPLLYDYFSDHGRDMSEEFYPDRVDLLDATAYIHKVQELQQLHGHMLPML